MATGRLRCHGRWGICATAMILLMSSFTAAKLHAEDQKKGLSFSNVVVALTVSGCQWTDLPNGRSVSFVPQPGKEDKPYVGFFQQGKVIILFAANSANFIVDSKDGKLVKLELVGDVFATVQDPNGPMSKYTVSSQKTKLDLSDGMLAIINDSSARIEGVP